MSHRPDGWLESIKSTAHMTQAEAAKSLGISRATVFNWRKAAGIETTSFLGEGKREDRHKAFRNNLTDSKHGRPSSYNSLGCRCDQCTKAWAQYCKTRRLKLR